MIPAMIAVGIHRPAVRKTFLTKSCTNPTIPPLSRIPLAATSLDIPKNEREEENMKKKNPIGSESMMSVTQVGVLIERFESNLKVVADGIIGLRDRVDGLERKVDDVRANQAMTLQKITMLEIHARKTDQRLDRIDARLDGIDARLDGIELRVEKLEITVVKVLDDTTEIRSNVKNHGGRISRLESFFPDG